LSTEIVEGKADSPGIYALPSTADGLSTVLPVNGVGASIDLSESDFGSVIVLLSAVLPSNCFEGVWGFGAYALGSYVFECNVLDGV
jgi:hypothetical protein